MIITADPEHDLIFHRIDNIISLEKRFFGSWIIFQEILKFFVPEKIQGIGKMVLDIVFECVGKGFDVALGDVF